MIRIGILSENYEYDGKAIRALLGKKYVDKNVLFIPVVKRMEGDQLENIKKIKRLLIQEAVKKKLDFFILARDLDGLPSETEKIEARKQWFKKLEDGFSRQNLFLLLIYEIEALILADIATFNQEYNVKINVGNPLYQPSPKEFLMGKTAKASKKYHESHTPNLFSQLNFNTIYQNHQGDISF